MKNPILQKKSKSCKSEFCEIGLSEKHYETSVIWVLYALGYNQTTQDPIKQLMVDTEANCNVQPCSVKINVKRKKTTVIKI